MSENPPRRPPPTPRGQAPRRPPMRRAPQQRPASGARPPADPQGAPRPARNVSDPFEEFRRKKEQAQAARSQREGGTPAYGTPTQAPPQNRAPAPHPGQHQYGGHQAPQQNQQPQAHPGHQQAPQGGYQQTPSGQQARRQTGRMSPQRAAPAGSAAAPDDPFEAFRRKKEQAKLDQQQQTHQAARAQEGLQNIGWVEGIGPASTEPQDPNKPRGFSRGRYKRKAIDPSTLQRPAGFERTKLTKHGAADHSEAAKNARKIQGFQRF
ncbi:MAG: hypothetical protein P1V97_26305 [Planctomycetota bacterium]|nr:hypothetical protein [Planctomycetota bacterium]